MRPGCAFLIWLVPGVTVALSLISLLSIGVYLIIFGVALAVFAAFKTHARGIGGALVGAGLVSLYGAYLQYPGPGEVCIAKPVGNGIYCEVNLDPIPFLIGGCIAVALGIMVQLWSAKRHSDAKQF